MRHRVTCDAPGCRREAASNDAITLWGKARREGWTSTWHGSGDVRVYCPEHRYLSASKNEGKEVEI